MPAQMTVTARKQGWKSGLVYGVVFVVAIHGLTALLSWISGQDSHDVEPFALAACWGLFLAVFAGYWIYGRSISGRVLLDCGPCPGKATYLAAAVVLLILTATWGLRSASRLFSWNTLFAVSIAALFCASAFGRLQVREHGIWNYWGLVRWSKIASYCWTEDSTLLVSRRGRFSLRVAMPFPPEQRQDVDQLLSRFCAARDGT